MTVKSPHFDPVWLRQRYEVEGLSTYQMAALVERNNKCIYVQLRKFGIPTRPRGFNLATTNDNYMRRPGAINPFLGRQHTEETRKRLSETASRPKPHLRGKANGMSGRTGVSNPNYRDGSSPERQRLYASGEWKATLRAVYARDRYTCQRCGGGKPGPRGLHAHHMASWAGNEALRFDLTNIVVLCRPCHHWVHSSANTKRIFLA